MNEFTIQALLWRNFTKTSRYMFSNIFCLYGELNKEIDFLLIDDKGHAIEYEIKCSREDFTSEFKDKSEKHVKLAAREDTCPNRYNIICPERVAKLEEIPEYAGFIELQAQDDGTYKYKIWKKAPLLHNYLMEPRSLFDKLYYRYFNHEQIRYNNDRKRIRKSGGLAPPKVSKTKKRGGRRRIVRKRKRTTKEE